MFVSHARDCLSYSKLLPPTALLATYVSALHARQLDVDVCKAVYHGSLPRALQPGWDVQGATSMAGLPSAGPALQRAWAGTNVFMMTMQVQGGAPALTPCNGRGGGGGWYQPAAADGVLALCECVQLLVFVRAVLCYVAPLALTYVLECRFRRRFADQRGLQPAAWPSLGMRQLRSGERAVVFALVLHLVLGVLWQALGLLPKLMWVKHLLADCAVAAPG